MAQTRALLSSYVDLRYRLFRSRYQAGLVYKVLLALGVAGLTGLAAQVRIPLPWSPVPVTAQTFAVLLSGVLLGRWWGGASMALYAGLGALGVPWFSGWAEGLFRSTGGYILGFILASLFLGHMTDRYIRARSFFSMLALMLLANFLLIHSLGLIGLGLWLSLVKGSAVTLTGLLWMGTIPFIPGDITKAVVAAAIARGATPKEAYNGEVDRGKWQTWRLP